MASHSTKRHKVMVTRGLLTQCVFFFMFLVRVATFFLTEVSSVTGTCDKQRKTFTDSYGAISSGDKEYAMNSHCEWLIKANSTKQFITLNFLKMDTECSYDHVFVYDGDSYSSPLLGSFSGNSTPSHITAKNGYMLILLYSDTNYVRTGFHAVYTITDCPLNCSEKGLCIAHECICDSWRTGDACDIELCPSICEDKKQQGQCSFFENYKDSSQRNCKKMNSQECLTDFRKPKCKCRSGYSGMDCSLPDTNRNTSGSWHVITPDGFYDKGRAGHSGVYIEHLNIMYIFGGYTFGKVLGDLLAFDFVLNLWRNFTVQFGPSPRRDHAAVSTGHDFVLYGGELENRYLSDELWLFNTSSHSWKKFQTEAGNWPPSLTKHSLTLVDDYRLYLFGGALADGTYSSDMFTALLDNTVTWKKINSYGVRESRRKLVGHTAVFYEPSRSIFIYGGVTVELLPHGSRLNPHIYAFHIDKHIWTRIYYPTVKNTSPLERAFHTAAIIGDFMVVYGGYTHRHSDEEICYDNEAYLYHLKCHRWIDSQKWKTESSEFHAQGIFAHSMAVRHGHTLLIHGGYSGIMHSRLIAYVLPSAITGSDIIEDQCYGQSTMESCAANFACGWCPDINTCVERRDKKACNNMLLEPCPGICSTLNDCTSCLIWGDPAKTNTINDYQVQEKFPVTSCTWYVQGKVCLIYNDTDQLAPYISAHNNARWWGSNETMISSINECYSDDFPPGLISVKYRHPINWSQPDDVSLLVNATELLNFRLEAPTNETSESDQNIVKFLAFIHPLVIKTPPKRQRQQKLHMCSSGSGAVLKLSTDTSKDHLEIVGNHSAKPKFFCSNVYRAGGSPIFPDTNHEHKYLLEFMVNTSVYINQTSLQLSWDAFSQNEVISYCFLEPYKNGDCAQHTNCLSCLTDNACGWCELDSRCVNKQNFSETACHESGPPHSFVTNPRDCSRCSDFVYCEQCTETALCEWLVETAHCVRRGRFKHSIRQQNLCPAPCQQRENCSSCLGDPGVCAWCEATQTCFLFSTYTTSYMFGLCRDWVDENRSEPNSDPLSLCRDCTRYENCSQCLQDLSCGWCSISTNPIIGVCVSGDFKGPTKGICDIQQPKNGTLVSEASQWSYESCPDIDECFFGLHDCHSNSTCKNTIGSFICECNIGFKGDGRTCIRACAEQCLNGICSEDPDYKCICYLGWTGDDCGTNCGCNNHSFCPGGIGICDKCENWTEGEYCEKCRPGSYGNALTSDGCFECNCNGHGNVDLGYCNSTSGACFCENDTEGFNCSKCKPAFYGDPRNGGVCFEECRARGVKTDIGKGRLGCSPKSGARFDCLWMLTVYPALDVPSLLRPMLNAEAFIELVIHKDMKISCPHNYIYVYDGLPDFIAPTLPNVLLGSFCGTNLNHSLSVTATSGYLTIHFKRNMPNEAFSASYRRVENFFDNNQTCSFKDCDNYSISINNDKELCPNNCSGSKNHGICDVVYGKCICENGHAGNDCSMKLKPHSLVWTSVYNYEHTIERNWNMPSGRIGHSLLAINNETDDFENLWLFGGYSPVSRYMSDVFMFEPFKRQWVKIETVNTPPPRHFHSAAIHQGYFYVFGGLNGKTALGDFWKFDTVNVIWFSLPTHVDLYPMAGSSLTAVENNVLLLIGGLSTINGFFDRIAEFNTSSQEWSYINCTGAQPIGVYGHSSVYHSDTESVYVFGGVSFDVDNVVISRNLYAFHYPSKQWFSLPPDVQVNPLATRPQPMYFHSAVVTKNYMIVFGGRSSNDLDGFPEPYAYIFSCNLWISLNDEDIGVVGVPPENIVGGSSAVANGDAYVFGGLDGELIKVSMPVDFCQLFSHSKVGCIRHTGCTFCSVHDGNVNHTYCYSRKYSIPSSCYNPKKSSEVIPSASCTSEWIEKRDCGQYSTCSDCVASWPAFSEAKQVCQWCSNCKVGRCIPSSASCENQNDCNIPRKIINESSSCPLRMCYASDCDKCSALGSCIWTSQVQRSSGFGHMLNKKPIYNWVCVMKEVQEAPPFNISAMPPLPCPSPCSHHNNCSSCLQSSGGEGGWHQCLWSESLHSCLSPSYELLRCEDSSCGPVLIGNDSQCPVPCWHHEQASHCLAHAHCGWCAFSGPKVDGRGLCIEGGIMSPVGGWCSVEKVLLLNRDMPAQAAKWLELAVGPPHWSYLTQPPENECENGHHTCDEMHEVCVDTPFGFECKCKEGYNLIGNQCKPICKQGCVNGTCVQPDVCECNFGYVGKNCSIPCKCNGHSVCLGPRHLDVCVECLNNTQGPNCQKCNPFFVGNPVNNGKCVPCHSFCYGHSSVCLNPELISNNGTLLQQPFNQSLISELLEKVTEGAWNDAVCIDCQNNTEGNRCDQCVSGYFKAGEHIEDGCRLCECHGHGDICNPSNGENCNCQNNTENDRQCSQKNTKNIITPCWQLQCSKCKEYFLGAPANGHQCYRHMFLDKDYCFDPNNQEKCNEKPFPLPEGRTVFFAVQPRYMNVDIRIVVDVTEGGVDFLLSAKEDTFVVDVNQTSGIHYISVDRKYGQDLRNEFEFIYHNLSSSKSKRDTTIDDSLRESSNVSSSHKSSSLIIRETEGTYLTTYVTIKRSQEFLLVRNLENRLVITIPQNVHDLRSTRFYMILRGAGSKTNSSTYGSLFFRQDQTRIDLFVFFSVFFSCFFLFLAICVVVWKVKQVFDVRRARRLHAAEMKHMASRPFGHVITIVDDETEDYNFTFYSPTNCRKKTKHSKVYGRDSPKANDDRFYLRPISVEPLSNGTAAVATILVQLPGGAQSLVKMTLASALITSRSSHYHVGYGIRAAMRRRTSHAV